MKARRILSLAGLLVVVIAALWYGYRVGQPRRVALKTLSALNLSLQSGDARRLIETVVIPAAVRDRTLQEQVEFVRKALAEEISSEGVRVLQREGRFGPLREIFPDEAEAWASGAGVPVDDCVAFKLDQHGLRTEVVLLIQGESCRIVRCNNVKRVERNL